MNNPAYQELKLLVEEHMLDFLPEIEPMSRTLQEAMSYSLSAGGKRIRPVLLLAACRLAGGDLSFALPFACAAEYIHTYSLIHDDLPAMDDDDLRRGKPTNHIVYGEAMAILAGDGLLAAAYELMTKQMLMYLDDSHSLRRMAGACYELSKGSGVRGMIAGQVADIEAEGKDCSKEMLAFIHNNKTAALIKAVLLAGCTLGGGSSSLREDLHFYGENVGLAFQIVDDILDVMGDESELGKRTKSDAEAGKATFPACFGIEDAKLKAAELLEEAREHMLKYEDDAEIFNYLIDFLEGKIKNEGF